MKNIIYCHVTSFWIDFSLQRKLCSFCMKNKVPLQHLQFSDDKFLRLYWNLFILILSLLYFSLLLCAFSLIQCCSFSYAGMIIIHSPSSQPWERQLQVIGIHISTWLRVFAVFPPRLLFFYIPYNVLLSTAVCSMSSSTKTTKAV